jgi:hypothetical protein
MKVGNTKGKLLSSDPIPLTGGGYGLLYANPDGSARVEPIGNSSQIENKKLTQNVVDLLKAGIIDVSQVPENIRAELGLSVGDV